MGENVDRHCLELDRGQLVLEGRHRVNPTLGDGLDDRGAVTAVEIEVGPGQVGGPDRVIAGAFVGMAVEAVASGVVVEPFAVALDEKKISGRLTSNAALKLQFVLFGPPFWAFANNVIK